MNEEERHAHDLAAAFRPRLGTHVEPQGAGVHWHVDVGDGARTCRVHCFHYSAHNPFAAAAQGTVTLGLQGNAHQSKVRVGRHPEWVAGAEYFTEFHEGGDTVATSRVRAVADVLDAAERWLAGASLSEMYAAFTFVDERARQRRAIRDEVNSALARLGSTQELRDDTSARFGGSEHGELWAYAGERSCRVAPGADGLEAAVLLHRTPLARVGGLRADELARVLAGWMEEERSAAALSCGPGRWDVSERADLFEQGRHAEWHWVQVRAQARHGGVLSLYAPLLDLIAGSEVASRFFSFTSLNSLCFSRCLLYPFDTEGMPVLGPRSAAKDAAAALRRLEDVLSRDEGRVHPGSVDDAMADEVNDALVRAGSGLRAEKVQERQWSRVVVRGADGRTCRLTHAGGGKIGLAFGTDSVELPLREGVAALMSRFERGDP